VLEVNTYNYVRLLLTGILVSAVIILLIDYY
jgi:hypothetical protein